MVKDDYMRNKLETITIIFDTGNINSCGVVLSTKFVILGNFSKLYLFNNTHTRSIGMFLVLLNNFDVIIKSGKCANRFYDYRYFCFKYRNIHFALNGIPYKCTKYGQLRYRMFCYLFNACSFKKVLSSFLCSFAPCFKFRVRIITHIIISTNMVCMVTMIFLYFMNFSSGMIIRRNINVINIYIIVINFDTVFQSQYHEIICALKYSTRYRISLSYSMYRTYTQHLYRTVCTLNSTVSQYRTVSTTVPDFINVIFYHVNVNVNCDPTSTATNIKLALYFNKCFFATTCLW